MDPARFNECLKLLYWDVEGLANILGCDLSLTRAWSLGLDDVPFNLGEWLDTLGMVHYMVESTMPTNLRGKFYAGKLDA